MKTAAEKEGTEVDIVAYPVSEMDQNLEGVDVALLGPQVGYMKAKSTQLCSRYNVPLDVIPMVDYGMCNGEKVLQFAKSLVKG